MSTKKQTYKGNGQKVTLNETTPRAMEAISKEYSEVLAKVGQSQYLTYVYNQEAEQYNKQLLSLNQEAAARQKLDQEAKAATQETQVPAQTPITTTTTDQQGAPSEQA